MSGRLFPADANLPAVADIQFGDRRQARERRRHTTAGYFPERRHGSRRQTEWQAYLYCQRLRAGG